MRSRVSNLLGGAALILAGLVLGGRALDLWDFNVFFDGWWTLFIIVPCALALIRNGPDLNSFIGVAVGVLLLLSAQDILDMRVVWKLLVPAILILVGVRIMFRDTFFSYAQVPLEKKQVNWEGVKSITAIFSGREERVNGRFEGAQLSALFGGIDLNLKEAVIDRDVHIDMTVIFGGIDILVPPHVRVIMKGMPIFGGTDNKAGGPPEGTPAPTIYVDAVCIFGGIEIK